MEEVAEQSLEQAREHTRIATERKIQAELDLQEAREAEFRRSRQGVARARYGAFSNLRRCVPAVRVAESSSHAVVSSSSQTEPLALPPISSLVPPVVHREFSEPPASPTFSIFTGEPVATSTPVCAVDGAGDGVGL